MPDVVRLLYLANRSACIFISISIVGIGIGKAHQTTGVQASKGTDEFAYKAIVDLF